jgi:hypothetical protein
MFPEETAKHLAILKDIADSTFALSMRSKLSFVFYGCNAPKVPCDLTCGMGRNEYLTIIKPPRISKFGLDSGFSHTSSMGRGTAVFPPVLMICAIFVCTLRCMCLMIFRGKTSRRKEIDLESHVTWCAM